MPSKRFEKFLGQLRKLRVDRGTARGVAPHKPVLLLAVLEEIAAGRIPGKRVYLTPELVAAFRDVWAALVVTDHRPNISLPFFHLRSAPFWSLVPRPGMEKALKSAPTIRALPTLDSFIAYAELAPEIRAELNAPEAFAQARETLLAGWFPKTKDAYALPGEEQGMLGRIEEEMRREGGGARSIAEEEPDEETLFVRKGAFKRVVGRAYNYTCCMTGLRIVAASEAAMFDACHIVPFAVSGDDHAGNGLSLCPNLHRAFDRGLVSVRPGDYAITVSGRFSETAPLADGLRRLEGRPLALPAEARLRPSPDALAWHFSEVFLR